MAEITEQDRAKADDVLTLIVCGRHIEGAPQLVTFTYDGREIIARALADAREQAASFDSSTPPGVSPLVWVNGRKAAPKGHVLTDEGVVLKVLGSLPVTADGCVVCVGGLVWMHGDEFGEPTPVSALVQEVAEDDICYHNAANDDGILSGGREVGREWLSNCYSTRAAAEASRTEGQ